MKYAVKCLENEIIGGEERLVQSPDRFSEEVEFLSELHHPNVISMVDYFQQFRHEFIVMELCDMDLISLVFGGEIYDWKDVFAQILEAIIYIHDKGIYHRDLKLDNVLIERDGQRFIPKLADFGWATKEEFSNGVDMGTHASTSPEILNGGVGVSWEQNDIWSLGVILISLATRQQTWENPSETPTYLDNMKYPKSFMKYLRPMFAPSGLRPTARELKVSWEYWSVKM